MQDPKTWPNQVHDRGFEFILSCRDFFFSLCLGFFLATSFSSLTFSVCLLLSLVLCVDLQAVGSGQHCCMCIHIFLSFLATHKPSTICAVYCLFLRCDVLELCDCGAAAAHNGMASCWSWSSGRTRWTPTITSARRYKAVGSCDQKLSKLSWGSGTCCGGGLTST